MGLPQLPPFATEQVRSRPTEHQHNPQLSAEDLEAVAEASDSVLEWLDRIAGVLLTHRRTPVYQEALRKSGDKHGVSGYSDTEQKARAVIRKAKVDMQTAKALCKTVDQSNADIAELPSVAENIARSLPGRFATRTFGRGDQPVQGRHHVQNAVRGQWFCQSGIPLDVLRASSY